jgi:hypothetical protein
MENWDEQTSAQLLLLRPAEADGDFDCTAFSSPTIMIAMSQATHND